jgi:DNA-binding NtrC family response regulator
MAYPQSETSTYTVAATSGRILLVDDQPELRRLFRRSLARFGHEVVEAWNGRAALELVKSERFDVVVSDVRMPDMGGIDLLRSVFEIDRDLPVMLVSGAHEADIEQRADQYGAFAYLMKPVPFDALNHAATCAIALRRERAGWHRDFEPYASVERLKVPHSDVRHKTPR